MMFSAVDLSLVGPFGKNQMLYLGEGVNLILGSNGSGKTTIAKELLRSYRATFSRRDLPLELAIALVFIGDDYCHNLKRAELIVAATTSLPDTSNLHVFAQIVSYYVNRMIAKKVLRGGSKFDQLEDFSFPFEATISNNNTIRIASASGADMGSYFSASGDSLLLSLACNFALRDLLQFPDPLVVDDGFSLLDESLLSSIYRIILKLKNQRVLLCSPVECERIGIEPHHSLDRDENGLTMVMRRRA